MLDPLNGYQSWETPQNHSLSRRSRSANLEHICHGSPDSGYGSGEELLDSIFPSPKTRYRYCHGLDGQGSWSALDPVPEDIATARRLFPAKRAASLPTQQRQGEKLDGRAPYSASNSIYSSGSPVKRGQRSSPRTPDRFVPFRNEASSAERYQTTKQPATLSRLEKLVRRDFILRDPFAATPRFQPSASSSFTSIHRLDGECQ